MYTAYWNSREIAVGDDVIEVENRLYFRPGDVRRELLRPAPERSLCEWKAGEAEYFDVIVGNDVNRAAAWCYPRTGSMAWELVGRIAFWRGIDVAWTGPGPAPLPRTLDAAKPNVAKALGAAAVLWRPVLPAALRSLDGDREFSGYLVPEMRVLIDVIETPSDEERGNRIATARAFGRKVLLWNREHPSEHHYGYLAVWGSATPAPEVISALRARKVVVALTSPAEILSS
jgi:uncharacterized protein (DUF427 family)